MIRTGFRFRPVVRASATRPFGRLLRLSAWTLGFVAANQVSLIVVRNLAGTGIRRRVGLPRRLHVLRAPPRPAGRVDRHDVPTGDGTRGRPQGAPGVRRPGVARRPDDRAVDDPGRRRHLRAAAADRRRAARARPVRRDPTPPTRRERWPVSRSGSAPSRSTCSPCAGSTPTRTPARPFIINVVENVINIVLAVVLVGRYGVLGLGLAFAIAYVLSSIWAL